MPLYAFSCGEHETEAIRPVGTAAVTCRCGKQAERRSVYAPSIGQKDIRYHGKDFIEASSEIAERADEMSKREGVAVRTPDFFGMARRRAARMKGGHR